MQPLYEFGGQANAPVLHLAVANGFVPHTYLPLVRPFFEKYRVVSLPPRALWGNPQPPPLQDARDWTHLADDLIHGFDHYHLDKVVAVGHSFGGIASMIAAIQHPERFHALILLDPTILPEYLVEMLSMAFQSGQSDQHPLAQAALKRKRVFDSPQAFYERFRQRPLFANWDEEAFQAYVDYGTQPNPDGEGVTLTWSPEWEAFYFSTGYGDTWQVLPQLNHRVPTLIIQGAISDTYITDSMEKVKALVPSATHISIPAHGHLFPHSAPQQTATIMADWLATL